MDTTRAKRWELGPRSPRKAQPDGDEDDATAVRAIIGELGGCGVPQMGIAAESLRLAVASDGPMRNQVRSHLEARRCAAGLDFLIAVDDYKHTRGPDATRSATARRRCTSASSLLMRRPRSRCRGACGTRSPTKFRLVSVDNDVFAAAAAYVSKALARDASGRLRGGKHRDDPCFWRRCDGQGRVRRAPRARPSPKSVCVAVVVSFPFYPSLQSEHVLNTVKLTKLARKPSRPSPNTAHHATANAVRLYL